MRQDRGLTKDGKWVYGWYFHLHNYAMNDGSPEREIHGIFDDSGLSNPVDWEGTIHRASYTEVLPETVGRSTGLKDKNGREIHEGDIAIKDGKKYVIRYSLHCFDLACNLATDDWPKREDGYSYLGTSWHDIEIIGNIHQNPELLKD